MTELTESDPDDTTFTWPAQGLSMEFCGEVWHWRGPAPYHFVSVPDENCGSLQAAAPLVSYGWGMIPVAVRVGATEWTTSLWPKNGGYVVPNRDRYARPGANREADRWTMRGVSSK